MLMLQLRLPTSSTSRGKGRGRGNNQRGHERGFGDNDHKGNQEQFRIGKCFEICNESIKIGTQMQISGYRYFIAFVSMDQLVSANLLGRKFCAYQQCNARDCEALFNDMSQRKGKFVDVVLNYLIFYAISKFSRFKLTLLNLF